MRLRCVEGKNFKKFIHITLEDKNDIEGLKYIRSAVTRSEFKPFIKSFNKTITQSYLINDTYVPAQFIQEIKRNVLPALNPKPIIENSDILFNNEINREDFNNWLNSLKLPDYIDISNETYSYQLESVYRALLFQIARIEVTTGGGKTFITYLYCKYLLDNVLNNPKFLNKGIGEKILIVVPRTDLCKQTAREFTQEFDSLSENKILVDTIYANSKRVNDAHIIIGNWQSVKNYDKEWFDQFGAIIVDEVHTAKVYSIKTEIYDKSTKTLFWFGMTGTYPEEKTLDYLNIVAMFGPSVLTKQTKSATEDGIITPVKIAQVKINYITESDFATNMKASGIVGIEKFRAEKVFFQNHTGRKNIIIDCINKIEGNQVILVDSVQYVKDLLEFISEKLPDKKVFKIHGEVSGKEREEIKTYMQENDDAILVATYETMSTGVNIKNIMAIHFPDGGRSRIRIKQSVGRGVRLHPKKEYLVVFDYQDQMKNSSFRNHWIERNKLYANEGHNFAFQYEYDI